MQLSPMDYVRGALLNALAERMTVGDLYAMAEHADTPQSFDHAVNTLAQTSESYLDDLETALAMFYPK